MGARSSICLLVFNNKNTPLKENAMKKNFINDKGGTRSGNDRRQKNMIYVGLDRRSGRDRRSGNDRREGSIQHKGIERRDIFRKKSQHKI
jgi:hypothetical protein